MNHLLPSILPDLVYGQDVRREKYESLLSSLLSTLTECLCDKMETISPLDGDREKQSNSTKFAVPSMSDDGSLRGWAVVAGSWFASESLRNLCRTIYESGIELIVSVLYFRLCQ